MVRSPTSDPTAYDSNASEAIMDLASPWHNGLRLLLEAGVDPEWAIQEAFRRDDTEALNIALGFPG